MSRLALYLLGPPRLERASPDEGEGQSVRIGRTKAVALLAYLAVTAQPHRRDALVTLLSPELDTARAARELRRSLYELNRLLGPGYLVADRETVHLDVTADASQTASEQALWIDVAQFRLRLADCETHGHPPHEACADCLPLLTEAVQLYRDHFLAGFTLSDSLAFEEWQFFQAEELRQALGSALQRLVRWYSTEGEQTYERAIAYARRWLAMDPLHEPAHRQLMALYAQSGHPAAALRQYRVCLRTLEEELGVRPAPETTALYERIRAERAVAPPMPLPPPITRPTLPAFVDEAAEPTAFTRPVFVAREWELAQLQGYLEAALDGRGQIAFVTGGPGRGKTALTEAFARQAMEAQPRLLVAVGRCNAYTGVGDPYLPFRDVMGMLTGDVEGRWAAGAITQEHALRLWNALPVAGEALADRGAPLIDLLLPGQALLARVAALDHKGVGWQAQLRTLIERERPQTGEMAQSQLFEGYTDVLQAVAAQHPLLLVLDDLQWADSASISLLFHLGRGLAGSRVLILGAYRPEEVTLGRAGQRHPLEKVLAEFKRQFGDVWLDLTQADATEGQRFVEAFLDSEPNRLGEAFRNAFFQRTRGHPLFTVELLRAMQERGHLVEDADADGAWIEGPTLDWERLPARVEGVIEERIRRLDGDLQDILSIACVEGEEFTAQVIARVGDIPERELLRALSTELQVRHRLVQEVGENQIDGRFLSHYRFSHVLFQRYMYNALSSGERRLLHGEIAQALESFYRDQIEGIAAQLARHYAEAGRAEQAIDYSLRAGDQARVAYADQEAIDHYRRALAFLQDRILSSSKELGDYERAARTLMKLGLTYHNAFQFQQARQVFDEAFALRRRAATITPAAPRPPAPHALRLQWKDPVTLDPTMAADSHSSGVIFQLFSGLVELSPELDIVPDVAHSWEMSEGGRRFVFHLRDDVRWSDGTPLTAADFEFAWKRVLNPVTGSHNSNLLHDIKGARAFQRGEEHERDLVGVRALDAVTLEVELEEPTGYFLHLLANSIAFPVPRHVVETHGEAWVEPENIVTNGPFELGSWHRGESMQLVRNPAYHAQFLGNVQQVELFLWPWEARSVALELYEADGLDIAFLPDPPEGDLARQRHPEEYASIPSLATKFVGFDVSRLPFNDARVRRAFVLAVDREQVADVRLGGYVFPATGGFVPPGMPGHSPGIGLPYDPDRAKQLLAEAGYPGGRGLPTLDALAVGLEGDRQAEVIQLQAYWHDNLGVDVEWQALEVDVWLDRVIVEPPRIHLSEWAADYPDPDDFLRAMPFRRRTRWRNDAYDRLVEKARHATAQSERLKMYQQADAILVEEAPLMPIYYARDHILLKPWVSRLPTSSIRPGGWWKDVIIEPH